MSQNQQTRHVLHEMLHLVTCIENFFLEGLHHKKVNIKTKKSRPKTADWLKHVNFETNNRPL